MSTINHSLLARSIVAEFFAALEDPARASAIDAFFRRVASASAEPVAEAISRLPRQSAPPEPIPHKLTVGQFAWCIERSAYFVNEQTRINPKLRAHVQGRRPKLIHPAALQLFGVDPALAAERLKTFVPRGRLERVGEDAG